MNIPPILLAVVLVLVGLTGLIFAFRGLIAEFRPPRGIGAGPGSPYALRTASDAIDNSIREYIGVFGRILFWTFLIELFSLIGGISIRPLGVFYFDSWAAQGVLVVLAALLAIWAVNRRRRTAAADG